MRERIKDLLQQQKNLVEITDVIIQEFPGSTNLEIRLLFFDILQNGGV